MAIAKATHCKECGEKFNDIVKKYLAHAMCYPCYLAYQRKRYNFWDNQVTKEFKLEKRKDVYKIRSQELKNCKSREEWLPILTRNLEEALNELNKQL